MYLFIYFFSFSYVSDAQFDNEMGRILRSSFFFSSLPYLLAFFLFSFKFSSILKITGNQQNWMIFFYFLFLYALDRSIDEFLFLLLGYSLSFFKISHLLLVRKWNRQFKYVNTDQYTFMTSIVKLNSKLNIGICFLRIKSFFV